jgi:hypothetical protein
MDTHNTEYTFQQSRAMSFLVDIMLRRELYNQAIAYCNTIMQNAEKLLNTSPGNTEYNMLKAGAYRGLAIAHSKNVKHQSKATEEYEQYRSMVQHLLKKSPDNPRLKIMYADALIEKATNDISRQKMKQVRQHLEQAIALMNEVARKDRENARVQQMQKKAQGLLESLTTPAPQPDSQS